MGARSVGGPLGRGGWAGSRPEGAPPADHVPFYRKAAAVRHPTPWPLRGDRARCEGAGTPQTRRAGPAEGEDPEKETASAGKAEAVMVAGAGVEPATSRL